MFSLKNGLALAITRMLIVVTVVVWISYDFFIYAASGNPSTISAVILNWSNHMPAIPFAFGILMGHFFFQLNEQKTWPGETPTSNLKSYMVTPVSNFDVAVKLVLEHEGSEYTDDPNDAGGPTKYGITIADFNEYSGITTGRAIDIQNMTMALAIDIYRKLYWNKLNLNGVRDSKLATVIMDQGVLRGVGHIARVVQAIVGTDVDGMIGPITLKAIDQLMPSNIYLSIINQEIHDYALIVERNPSQIVFLDGWLNRMTSLNQFCFEV